MKIDITGYGVVEYEYKPENIINDVRGFAAEKLQCNVTQLDVRLRGKGPYLKTLKTFKELDIRPTDILIVGFTKRNNPKRAINKVLAGETKNTKYNMTQVIKNITLKI